MRHRIRSLRFWIARVGLALLAVMPCWNRPVVAADYPVIRGVGTSIANPDRSLSVGGGPPRIARDAPDMVPISRVVPRAKTISPDDDRDRGLPPDSRTAQSGYRDDREIDDEAVEDELPAPPAPDFTGGQRQVNRPAAPSNSSRPISDQGRRTEVSPNRKAVATGNTGAASNRAPTKAQPAARPAGFLQDGPNWIQGLSDPIPAPDMFADPLPPEGFIVDEPWPQDPGGEYALAGPPPVGVDECHCWGPLKKFCYFNNTNGDIGIGHERVMFAPFEIETSQPANNFRLKAMSAFDLHTPDRAEYLWAKIGGTGPPLPELNVNYQNYDAIYEAGGKRFSLVTDIPLRSVHPENNLDGAGIGNISLAPKMVIVDGTDWQITQIFRTYLPTGATNRGTSNGLTSLEPGVLVRYRWSPRTFVHGQAKYWIPLSGDPVASGNVFNYGIGVSHVLLESDTFAIIPVLETVGWTVGGGTATTAGGQIISANTSFVNIQPGVRFVLGPKGDLGLCEFGISSGFATNTTGWYQEQLTFELRWSW